MTKRRQDLMQPATLDARVIVLGDHIDAVRLHLNQTDRRAKAVITLRGMSSVPIGPPARTGSPVAPSIRVLHVLLAPGQPQRRQRVAHPANE